MKTEEGNVVVSTRIPDDLCTAIDIIAAQQRRKRAHILYDLIKVGWEQLQLGAKESETSSPTAV